MLTAQDITRGNFGDYIDRTLRRPVDQGRPILAGHFIDREERGGARILPADRTAVTIGVDSTNGVAGLVRPGDHIDLYATTVREGAPETLLVLPDVTVMAVDNRISEPPAGLPGYSRGGRGYSSLTLMVSPEAAQLLIYLKTNAVLTCTLRSVQDLGKQLALPPVSEKNVRQRIEEVRRAEAAAAEGATAPAP
jgi:pilus assembly protein CpaB